MMSPPQIQILYSTGLGGSLKGNPLAGEAAYELPISELCRARRDVFAIRRRRAAAQSAAKSAIWWIFPLGHHRAHQTSPKAGQYSPSIFERNTAFVRFPGYMTGGTEPRRRVR